jgi:serine phosphatase RsbU (regulator of sigma subunit)
MMTPAKEVGGDLFDFFLRDEKLFFCIGDVSGKGVPAALFMAEVTRMFRTLVDGHLTPNAIATRLNHALVEDNEQGMFVTMFIGLINLKSGHMEFCNAGHNPPLLDGEYMKMEANAPIGLWPEIEFEGEEVDNMHGKTLFVYTDGINEAENANKEQFGDERLKALLRNDLGTARETSETIHKAVEEFVGSAEPSDDLTMLCLKIS